MNLVVYLSNRCNMMCDYCAVAVNEGPAYRLGAETLRRAVDAMLALDPSRRHTVSFLGGEPLLEWPVVEDAVRYARERACEDALNLQLVTNGTLLSEARAAFLAEKGVSVIVSLDGPREVNDEHRVFLGDKGRSTFEAVAARLGRLRTSTLGAAVVFGAGNHRGLVSHFDFVSRLGFGRMVLIPLLHEAWRDEDLASLKAVLKGFRRYYAERVRRGLKAPLLPYFHFLLDRRPGSGAMWDPEEENIGLGADGSYYACDRAFNFPYGHAAELRIGTPETGLDWDRRRELLAEARGFLERAGAFGPDYIQSPFGSYFFGRLAGRPAEPMLESLRRLSEVLNEAYLAMLEELRDEPSFRALYAR